MLKFAQFVGCVAFGAILTLTGGAAPAQEFRDAAHKFRGDYLHGYKASRYQQHAQDRSQLLWYYSQNQQPIPKNEAKELTGGIRKDLTTSNAALAHIKKEHAGEPDVVKLVESIEGHHAKALEHCAMTEKECAKDHGDHVVIGDCCSNMWHELDAAKADTQKLLKLLKIDKLEIPAKPSGGKDVKGETDKE